MKVAIYCRVSTDDKGQDPEVQLGKCRQYCSLHNHNIISEFIDEGVTGDSFYYDRPEGKKLYSLIEKQKVDGIVCFTMDRFSRQSPVKVLQLLQQFNDRGMKIISVSEPIFNMDGELSEPMRYLVAWFNNYFLKQHKVKVVAGMQKAKQYGTKSGKPIGRERKADYNQILNRYEVLKSISAVARELGCSKSSIKHCLDLEKRKQKDLVLNTGEK